MSNNQLVVFFVTLAFGFAVAMIPILLRRDIAVYGILLFILIACNVYSGILDYEHAFYCLINLILCGIIAEKNSTEYVRKTLDAKKITSARSMAEEDSMTRLLNRRGLENRIGTVWPMCVRKNIGVAVIMLDIDNFKKYNDSFGHGAGDDCIRSVTKVIKQSAKRKTDFAARVGGEEFLVVLTDVGPSDALKWSINLKNNIEKLKIPHAASNFLPYVTVSIGIHHHYVDKDSEFWELRNEADKALYQAKENGRACIFMDNVCYAKTLPDGNRKQYTKEKLFRSIY